MTRSYGKYFIPGAQTFIEHTLYSLGLTPEISIGDFIAIHQAGKHRYATLARDESGRKIIFYARLHKNEDARKKFLSDIFFLRALRKQQETQEFIPSCYQSSTVRDKEWFTREYISTRPLGNEYRATHRFSSNDINRLVGLFLGMQHIPATRTFTLTKHAAGFALPIMKGNLRASASRFSHAERTRIAEYFSSCANTLNDQANHVVHGDAHPGNILLGPRSLHLIDWETTHINLRVMDVAYFYTGLGLSQTARKKFLRAFERAIRWKQAFRTLFPFGVMFYALNHLYTLPYAQTSGTSRAEKNMLLSFYSSIVKSCANGYTALRRV